MPPASDLAPTPFAWSAEGRVWELRDPQALDRADYDLWNDRHFFQIDHHGRVRASFLQPNATSYADPWRCVYLRDEVDGAMVSLPWGPAYQPLDGFVCRFSPEQVVWEVRWRNCLAELAVTLPRERPVEVWRLSLRTLGPGTARLGVFPCVPVGLLGLIDHDGRYDADRQAVVHRFFPYYVKIEDYEKLRRRHNLTFLAADRAPLAWEANLEAFAGRRGLADPQALRQPRLDGGEAHYEAGVCALQYEASLAPDQSFTLHWVFGPALDLADLDQARRDYLGPDGFERARREQDSFRADHPAPLTLQCPDPDFAAYANHWLPDRLLRQGRTLRFNLAPQARNAIQDAAGVIGHDPAQARHWLERIWSHQQADGFLPHGCRFDPGADVMPISAIPHRDINVWGPLALRDYLAETGDRDLLDREVPFADGGSDSLAGHLERGLDWLWRDRTPRGLSRIGQGDWNDPLNMAGPLGRGESVWLTLALAVAAERWAEVHRWLGRADRAAQWTERAAACRQAVRELAWDGRWYRRATTDAGRWLGSAECAEGAIDLLPQAWALLAGLDEEDRVAAMVAAVEERLQTPAGPMLLAPAYRDMRTDVGKLTLKTPGTGENGSVYCHAAAFWACGLYAARRGEEAWRVLRALLPGGPSHPLAVAGHGPLYVPNFYRGTTFPGVAGRSSHAPHTGTPAWLHQALLDGLLGLRAEWDGWTVDPQLPRAWPGARARRRFRQGWLEVRYRREPGLRQPVVLLEGREVAGPLPPPAPGQTLTAEVAVG